MLTNFTRKYLSYQRCIVKKMLIVFGGNHKIRSHLTASKDRNHPQCAHGITIVLKKILQYKRHF